MNTEYQQCITHAQEVEPKQNSLDLQKELITLETQKDRIDNRIKEIKDSLCTIHNINKENETKQDLGFLLVSVYSRETKKVDYDKAKELLHPNTYNAIFSIAQSICLRFTIKKGV